MAHFSGFQAMGISIGAVEAILTIQIGDPLPIFALYLHVDNVNPNILSLLIESKGTQVFVMGTPVSESFIFSILLPSLKRNFL